MKRSYFLLTLLLGFMAVIVYTKLYSKKATPVPNALPVPIQFNKADLEELVDFKEDEANSKAHKISFKKVGYLKKPTAEFYNCRGWEDESGDFTKIKIKLKNNHIVEYDNRNSWIKVLEKSEPRSVAIADDLKVPEQSQSIHKHPYCVTLDMEEGNHIVILFGYPYASTPGLLTLVYVTQDNAAIIFNKEVDLLEISETAHGYRLLGQVSVDQATEGGGIYQIYIGQKCELLIENGELKFNKFTDFNRDNLDLPIIYDRTHIHDFITDRWAVDKHGNPVNLEKVGKIEDPSIDLYNYIGEYWDRHGAKHWDATPGDFSRIEFTSCNDVFVRVNNFEGGWVKLSDQIKVPQGSAKVKKHTHGITLDMGSGNYILVLTGYQYTSQPGLLTLVFLGTNNSGIIFNKHVALLAVEETGYGYRLLGKLPSDQVGYNPESKRCEIGIENGKLTFKEL